MLQLLLLHQLYAALELDVPLSVNDFYLEPLLLSLESSLQNMKSCRARFEFLRYGKLHRRC